METALIKAKELITKFEGFHEEAYLCPAGVWTVGWGFTYIEGVGRVRQGMRLSLAEADSILEGRLRDLADYILKMVKRPLTDNQLAALISFVFNVGKGAFSSSTLLAKLCMGDFEGAAEEFDRWVHVNGRVVSGLVRRRREERMLFLSGGPMTINLRNFFKYYNDNNPNHVEAVRILANALPSDLLRDSAEWVKVYRRPFGVDWGNFQSRVSEFFTVGEVTRWDRRRIPKDPDIQNNILTLAKHLDNLRRAWGGPIGVTSWYRPPDINRQVGGVPNSYHTKGLAADIYPINGRDKEFEEFVLSNWNGGVGKGMSRRGFVHVDLGPRRTWDY